MQTPPSLPEHDPYRAPAAHLAPPSSENHELADRWARLAAVLIDAVIALAVTLPPMLMTGYWQEAFEAGQSGGLGSMPLGTMLLWAVIGFALFAVIQGYPLHDSGQTWGKKLLSIRIVDLAGRKPPLVDLLLKRYLPTHAIVNIPCVGGLYALVDSLMIFRQDQRCLHDLIAGTRVVRAN
ncbi:putative RDD family membrane protein YckC [Pseudoxanthomonas sp. 3HH-4]|uniref:RDD family protein n=1 Tax=Pseudoxanthomonas sp. 3HH-4 TaxID=1690214 RepID=UPI001171BF81|nr:RDD family protein [Pseudoxanthomonas sp. 3HH-4]TQM12789.1 putative RDD family membrane protein YckC [Pseudoxanthomonas sp. 3HH-4]